MDNIYKKFRDFVVNEQQENDRIDYENLEHFLDDLGFKDMFNKFKNDPEKLKNFFQKVLKGKNLNKFNKLIDPPKTDKEKEEERLEKLRKKEEEINNKIEKEKERLRKLDKKDLAKEYIEVFKRYLDTEIVDVERILNYMYVFPPFDDFDEEDVFHEKEERHQKIIEDIANFKEGFSDIRDVKTISKLSK